MTALLIALSALTTLSGCGASVVEPVIGLEATAAEAIPELSREDARRCYDPGVSEGVDALEIIADHRVALSDCRQRHGRVVAQYAEVTDILIPSGEQANSED